MYNQQVLLRVVVDGRTSRSPFYASFYGPTGFSREDNELSASHALVAVFEGDSDNDSSGGGGVGGSSSDVGGGGSGL